MPIIYSQRCIKIKVGVAVYQGFFARQRKEKKFKIYVFLGGGGGDQSS